MIANVLAVKSNASEVPLNPNATAPAALFTGPPKSNAVPAAITVE